MQWDKTTGHVSKARAAQLGMDDLLEGYTK
jgi:hypothetical protein